MIGDQQRPLSRCLGAGLRNAFNWRAVLLLWLFSFIAALPLIASAWFALQPHFGDGPAAHAVLESRSPQVELLVLEFLDEVGMRRIVAPLIFFAIVITVLTQSFLAGGLVETAGTAAPGFFQRFFAGGARWFLRFVALSLLFGFSVLFIPAALFGIAMGVLMPASDRDGGGATIALYAAAALALFLFALLAIVYDLARAAVRRRPAIAFWASIGESFKLIGQRPFACMTLLLFWVVVAGGGVFALAYYEWSLAPATAAGVWWLAIVQQILILLRCAVRAGTWGSVVAVAD